MTVAALLALLATLAPWPAAVRPVLAEHTGMYVVCPDPILEGNSAQMQVRWKNHRRICATIFTYSEDFTAGRDDYAWFDGVWMVGESDSDSLWVPVTTKEDDKPERDETFSIGYWESGIWHGCVITIVDDDSPQITDVEISSKPFVGDLSPNGWTNQAERLGHVPHRREHRRDGDVRRSGRGGRQPSDQPVPGRRRQQLARGDLPQRLGNRSPDIQISGAARRPRYRRDQRELRAADDDRKPTHGFSGTINAKDTNAPAHLTHGGLPSSPDHKVDGRPYAKHVQVTSTPPDGWDAYRANQIVEFSMNSTSTWRWTVRSGWASTSGTGRKDGATPRTSAAPGTDTLVFAYTVLPGDMDTDGLSIALGSPGIRVWRQRHDHGSRHRRGADSLLLGHRPSGRPADRYVGAVHRIDRDSVTPRGWSGVSDRENVEVAVTFSEAVRINGAPRVELDIGGEARQASLASGQGSSETAVFHYTVAESDADSDGIGIGANSLRLNGGGIYDGAGNDAGLSHAAVAADGGQRVDTSPPQG